MRNWIAQNRAAALAVFAAILILIGFSAYNIYLSIQRSGKIQVTVALAPRDASFTVNGQNANPNDVYLTEGQYVFTAKKDGFAPLETHSYISKDKKTITMPLIPESDEAKKWAAANQTQYDQVGGLAGQAANTEGEQITQKNPVIRVLPFKNLIYSIGYRNDRSDPTGQSIIVTVDARAGNRNAAIRKLRQLGSDPAQLKIEFTNYESPFKNE